VSFVRLFSGDLKRGDKIYLLHNKMDLEVLEVGYFKPKYQSADKLECGEVGYVVSGLKEVSEARVGDTIWKPGTKPVDVYQAEPLAGYKVVKTICVCQHLLR